MALVARMPVAQILRRVHDRVFQTSDDQIVRDLAHALGRPTLARLTDVEDLKTITRWSMGKNRPSPERLERIRHAAMAYYALLELGLSGTNAEQWFRGANPVLDLAMPVDALRDGRYGEVLVAVQNHASE